MLPLRLESALLQGSRLGLGWPGSAWVWLALLRLAFGWLSVGFRLRLDLGLILAWLDLDLVRFFMDFGLILVGFGLIRVGFQRS